MTEATNTRLMDTEPGGEQTQYEGAQVFQNQIPRASKSEKQGASQSGAVAGKTDAQIQEEQEGEARGEKTAENMRYGESISEHGFGGETTRNTNAAVIDDEDDYGKDGGGRARRLSGYKAEGKGSGDEIGG